MTRNSYSYATAKIRVLERHLMSEADLTRVIDARDPESAFKAFNQLDYAGELLDLTAQEYRTAMDRKMARLKKMLDKVIPDRLLMRLLFVERDYYNIKVLFKELATGDNYDEHLELGEGLVKTDQLRRYIISGLSAEIDDQVKSDIDELKELIGDSKDPERIENLVDQRLNRRNLALAMRTRNQFIIELYKKLADKNNVSIFFRAKRLGKSAAWFAERVNEGGFIASSVLVSMYEGEEAEFAQKLPGYFGSVLQAPLESYLSDKHIWHLELGINNAIMEHLTKAKFIGFGPEVVIAYFFAKKYDIKNLSTIMALKFGEVEPGEIRKHLVNGYVLV